jgi:hypothetical protein
MHQQPVGDVFIKQAIENNEANATQNNGYHLTFKNIPLQKNPVKQEIADYLQRFRNQSVTEIFTKPGYIMLYIGTVFQIAD